jgi:hypothetical protein
MIWEWGKIINRSGGGGGSSSSSVVVVAVAVVVAVVVDGSQCSIGGFWRYRYFEYLLGITNLRIHVL